MTKFIPNSQAELDTDASGNQLGFLGKDGQYRSLVMVETSPDGGIGFLTGEVTASRIGTRIMSSTASIVSNQFDRTGLVAGRLAAPFDAIRLILINNSATACVNIKWAVSALPVGFDASSRAAWNNNSGTWVSGTISTAAPAVVGNPTLTPTPWVQLDGESACFSSRIYIPSAGNTDCTVAGLYKGNADAGGAAYASIVGDEWIASSGTAGDHIANIAGMTSVANADWGFIAGVQYRCKTGKVVTVMGIGDSIMHGTYGSINGNSYWTEALRRLKLDGHRVEQAQFGWSGQTTAQYSARAKVALPLLQPSVCIYAPFSPNDTTPTAATIAAQKSRASEIRSLCESSGIAYVPVTGIPYNYDQAADALRKSLNDEIRSSRVYIDADVPVSTTQAYGTAATITPSMTADGIHLLANGNSAISTGAESVISAALTAARI